jgi:hypothetical protein
VKTLTRPITIIRDPTVVTRAPTRPKGVPVTPELRYRTGSYVAGVVNGLANVVALEEFELSKPNRRVTSDLLLVRYPGSQRDLISYRDALKVNGAPIAGREERLLDLFVKPTDRLREQARRIMLGSEAYVPSMFNPIFVLGFLQTDFQSRFDLTVNDAGPEWRREVKAVTFVEVGRPTLLRTGAFGDIDAPTRGTAWIEEGTGRVLQTELQIGRDAHRESRRPCHVRQFPPFRSGDQLRRPDAAVTAGEIVTDTKIQSSWKTNYSLARISQRSGNRLWPMVLRRYSAPVDPPVPVFVPIVRSTIFTWR